MNTQLPASDSRLAATAAAIVDWIGGDECRGLDDADLVAGLGHRLQAGGLPVDRLVLHLRSLHPEVLRRVIVWAMGRPVEVYDRDHGIEFSAEFADSPVRRVMEVGRPLMVRPGRVVGPGWAWPAVFRDHGLGELFILPLNMVDGPACTISFCTRQPMGFSAADREIFASLVPALGPVCELRYRAD